LLHLAAGWLLFTADNDWVYFLGKPIHYVCAAKQRFGVPCPTCGFTRGFVLTVHGRIGQGWRLSPSGPLAAIGMVGVGAALVGFAAVLMKRPELRMPRAERWIRAAALSYGAASLVIWGVSWVSTILRMRT